MEYRLGRLVFDGNWKFRKCMEPQRVKISLARLMVFRNTLNLRVRVMWSVSIESS